MGLDDTAGCAMLQLVQPLYRCEVCELWYHMDEDYLVPRGLYSLWYHMDEDYLVPRGFYLALDFTAVQFHLYYLYATY